MFYRLLHRRGAGTLRSGWAPPPVSHSSATSSTSRRMSSRASRTRWGIPHRAIILSSCVDCFNFKKQGFY